MVSCIRSFGSYSFIWVILYYLFYEYYLTVSSYNVTYAFQSEFTLCSCLDVKELLARNRRDIWSLSDYNRTRTHSHLVRKRTLNYSAKLAKWQYNHSQSLILLKYFVSFCVLCRVFSREINHSNHITSTIRYLGSFHKIYWNWKLKFRISKVHSEVLVLKHQKLILLQV